MDLYSSRIHVKKVIKSIDSILSELLGGPFDIGMPNDLKNELYMFRTKGSEIFNKIDKQYGFIPVNDEEL